MANEKDINLNSNLLDDDALADVSGGKQMAESLVYKKGTNRKASKTLYSGESRQAGNLIYKDDDRVNPSEIPFDGPKLC